MFVFGLIKPVRGLLDWNRVRLALISRVFLPSMKRLESRAGQMAGNDRMQGVIAAALISAGIDFIEGGKTSAQQSRTDMWMRARTSGL